VHRIGVPVTERADGEQEGSQQQEQGSESAAEIGGGAQDTDPTQPNYEPKVCKEPKPYS